MYILIMTLFVLNFWCQQVQKRHILICGQLIMDIHCQHSEAVVNHAEGFCNSSVDLCEQNEI